MTVIRRLRNEDTPLADLVARFDKVMRADISHNLSPGEDLDMEDLLDLMNGASIQILVHGEVYRAVFARAGEKSKKKGDQSREAWEGSSFKCLSSLCLAFRAVPIVLPIRAGRL